MSKHGQPMSQVLAQMQVNELKMKYEIKMYPWEEDH